MIDTPHIVQTSTQLTAFIHVNPTWEEIQHVMGPGLEELMSAIAAQGLAPTGPWFAHHLRRPTETFNFKISVPVAAPVTPAGRVQPGEWPAMTVARTIYHGAYEGLGDGWGEFSDWLEANGHTTASDFYERYLTGPESGDDPASWRTEFNRPLLR